MLLGYSFPGQQFTHVNWPVFVCFLIQVLRLNHRTRQVSKRTFTDSMKGYFRHLLRTTDLLKSFMYAAILFFILFCCTRCFQPLPSFLDLLYPHGEEDMCESCPISFPQISFQVDQCNNILTSQISCQLLYDPTSPCQFIYDLTSLCQFIYDLTSQPSCQFIDV